MTNVGHPIPLVPLAYLVTYGEWQASNVIIPGPGCVRSEYIWVSCADEQGA